jgi:hypothetical protein
MYVMLCSTMDTSAQWAASGLARLLPSPLEVVLAETLAEGAQWEHRVDSDATHLKITLADGRVLCGSRIKGVVNRLSGPPQMRVRWPNETEQAYVQAEMHALYLSGLNGLPCVVINRPSPSCLYGRFLRTSEWLCMAAKAGLKTAPYMQTDDDSEAEMYASPIPDGAIRQSVIVAGDCVFPAWMSAKVKADCVQLAREAGLGLMGAELYLDGSGEWRFAGASSAPDLMAGGAPLLECMAKMLQMGEMR